MEDAASKIQGHFRKKQARKKAKEEKTKPKESKPKKGKEANEGYDRDAEKNQEIGEEFLNPDEDMEQAASKIQGHFRKKQARKKAKEDKAQPKEAKEGEK